MAAIHPTLLGGAIRRWQIISVDLIMELPQSHSYDSILVAVDRLSKRAHFIATTSDITSLGVARLFWDGIWKLHGLPEEVISDRGPQFVLNFCKDSVKYLGLKSQPRQPTTHRRMAKPNVSTRKSSNSYTSS